MTADLQIGTLPDGRVSAVVRCTDSQAFANSPSAEALGYFHSVRFADEEMFLHKGTKGHSHEWPLSWPLKRSPRKLGFLFLFLRTATVFLILVHQVDLAL